ncbi:MAG TPA: hypothetical protein VFR55_11420, partial [Dehalococcoidia bacterium]|nr:hypothetical protein [Dehalococcoidia bacterium]
EIQGIDTVVVWISDYSDEELVEKEIAFYAQDDDGTVWYLGEHPEAYEEGELVEAPTWIAGIEGARAGIVMPADPQVGTPRYSQGWAPDVDWTDQARVAERGLEVTVPLGTFQDVLVMEETSMEELALGVFQFKYYAPDVGVIKVGFTGEDETQETLEMTEFNQLDPDELEETNALALALEQHAYEISKDVYGLTAPSRAIASSSRQQTTS